MWLVFNKSNLLLAQCLDRDYKAVGKHIKISGHHKRTISREREGVGIHHFSYNYAGLASFSTSSFISSLDGSVQTFNLDTAASDGHVTPNPVTMATQGDGRGLRAQGVAVSEMGIFAAVSVK